MIDDTFINYYIRTALYLFHIALAIQAYPVLIIIGTNIGTRIGKSLRMKYCWRYITLQELADA